IFTGLGGAPSWVIGRNSVRGNPIGIEVADIEAQHLAEVRRYVLAVAEAVSSSPAVAGGEIEHSIRPERHAAAIVVVEIPMWNPYHWLHAGNIEQIGIV